MKYRNYESFKPSQDPWVGNLPDHWSEIGVKRIASIDNSGCYGLDEGTCEIDLPVATTAQINADGQFLISKMPIRSFTSAEVERYSCREDDILIVKSSGSATSIISGKAGLVSLGDNFVFSNFLLRIRTDKDRFNPKYLYFILTSYLTRERVKRMVSATTYPNLQVDNYVSALVPYPPLWEQERIAEFLSCELKKIDTLVYKQQQLIKLLKEKRQAVISYAVTKGLNSDTPMKDSGVEWLGEVPEHWDKAPLKYLVDEKAAGPYGASLTKAMYTTAGIKVYGQQQVISNNFGAGDYYVSEEKYKEMKRYTVFPDDVLISVMGTVGKVAVVPEDAERGIINPRLVRYKFDSETILPHFVQALIMSQSYQNRLSEASQGSTMEGLNMGILGDLPLVFPCIDEQEEVLLFINKEVLKYSSAIDKAEEFVELSLERRTVLISAAVTGKIDVRHFTLKEGQASANQEVQQQEAG